MNSSAMHKRRMRQRSKVGLVRLQSPWEWLGVQDAMKLAAAAYRVASYDARHVQHPQDQSTAHLSMQDMRELFCESLAQAFAALLSGAAVERRACWPDLVDRVTLAHRMVASVPDDWRPQYPQFGAAEPGKVSQPVESATKGGDPQQ